MNEYKYLHN